MPPRRKAAKKNDSDDSDGAGAKSTSLAGCAFAFAKGIGKADKDELGGLIQNCGGAVERSFTKVVTHFVCTADDITSDMVSGRSGVHFVNGDFIRKSKDTKADEAKFAVKPAADEESDDGTKKKKGAKAKGGKRKAAEEEEDDEDEEEPAPKKKGKAEPKKAAAAAAAAATASAPPPASPTVKQAVRKGRAVVDEHVANKTNYHVYDDGKEVYAVMLNQTDIEYGVSGHNKFYVIQLLAHDTKQNDFRVFTRWGRVGVAGQQADKPFRDIDSAKAEFGQKFKDKTGNVFGKDFTAKKGKYDIVEIDYGADPEPAAAAEAGQADKPKKPAGPAAECTLEPRVKGLMELISSKTMFEQTLISMHIDVRRMPLGKLSKKQIKEGYMILKQIEDLLNGRPVESGQTVESLSSRFYTKIPHDFGFGKRPPSINSLQLLDEPMKLLAVLADIEIAQEVMGDGGDAAEIHALDRTYRGLKAEIVPCEVGSKDWELVSKMVKDTHAPTHSSYALELLELFRVDRQGEAERFAACDEIPNKRLLWHGSRLGNFIGILSQGLRIAPPEAPATGYMFGKGVYFADLVSKSANYCATSPAASTGLMLLSEVALGSMYEVEEAEYMEQAPRGKQSTFGVGKMGPDPAGDVQLEGGVLAHTGKPVETKRGKSLLYNEYIVYDVSQVKVKYLLKLNFDHNVGRRF